MEATMNPDLSEILQKAENVAVIGCSKKPERDSCMVANYLKNQGYHIIPVHPKYDEVLGEQVYPTVQDIPENIRVDVVVIFRRPDQTAAMVDQVVERKKQTGQQPVVWTQFGVSSEEARQKAREAGLPYVTNRCMKVEHQRFFKDG